MIDMREIRSMTETELLNSDDYLHLTIAKERIYDQPFSHYVSVYVNRRYLERMELKKCLKAKIK